MNEQTPDHFEKCVTACMIPLCQKYGFALKEILEKGSARFIDYQGSRFDIEFIFGPPGFEVEMYINRDSQSYGLGELMQKFSRIDKWVRSNKLVVGGGDRIELEVRWFALLIEQVMDESILQEL